MYQAKEQSTLALTLEKMEWMKALMNELLGDVSRGYD